MNQIIINTESHEIEYQKQTFDYHEWGGTGDYAHYDFLYFFCGEREEFIGPHLINVDPQTIVSLRNNNGLYFTTSWQELMEEAIHLRKRKGFTKPPINQAELVGEALMDRIYGCSAPQTGMVINR